MLQVRCQLSTSFRCTSLISTACNAAAGALPALYIVPTHVSHFNRYLSRYRCFASSLHPSDVRLPFQALPISLHWQVHCQLSTSFRCRSLISTAFNTAVGVLPALYIITMGDSHFNSLKYDYRFVAGSLPRSNARLPFQHASPISTACNTATGAFPALYIVQMRDSHFNSLKYDYRFVAGSLPCSNARLPFQHASSISTACNRATGALPALYVVPMRDSHFNSLKYDYRFVAGSLPYSNTRLPFQQLAIRRQVRYPALYLIPTRVSHFNRLQYGYRCVASSLRCSNTRLPF